MKLRVNQDVLIVGATEGGVGYHLATVTGWATGPKGPHYQLKWFDRWGHHEFWLPADRVFGLDEEAEAAARAGELRAQWGMPPPSTGGPEV